MLAVTLLLDRDLGLGAPGVPARGRRFVTDRHGPAATNRAISADRFGLLADDVPGHRPPDQMFGTQVSQLRARCPRCQRQTELDFIDTIRLTDFGEETGMAIGIYFRPASMNAGQYDDIIRRLEAAGSGKPAGRLHHVCFGTGDSLQVFDIWESQGAFDKFGETLMPILQQVGLDPGEPMVEPVHSIIQG